MKFKHMHFWTVAAKGHILGKLVKAVGPSGRPQIENTPVVQWQ